MASRSATRVREPDTLEAISWECSADLYDQNFLAACTDAGGTTEEQAASGARCTCLLEQLRSGRGRGAGTQWLTTNVEVEPPTAEGEAWLGRAMAACP